MARRLLTLLAALLLALSFGQYSASAASFTNPVKAQKGADPWISYHNGNYYLVTTSWTDAITIRKSPTLAGLSTAPSVQVWTGDAASRCCNIWAPELHFLNGRWYLYYVAGQNVSDYIPTQRTHVLESAGSDPMGPYTYKNQLGSTWMLDPTVATINGNLYLFGSASGGGTQNLVAARMSNPYTVSGSFTTISTPTHDWERSGAPVNEGPEILQRNGTTRLIYSASGCWTPTTSSASSPSPAPTPWPPPPGRRSPRPSSSATTRTASTGPATTATSSRPTAPRTGSSTTPTTTRARAATTGVRRGRRRSPGTRTVRRTSVRR